MRRKTLEAYQANKRLIERNKQKIENEKYRDIPVIKGKVKGSSPEFPYVEQRFTVQMDDPAEHDKAVRRIRQWEKEIKLAERDMESVERFVSDIADVRDREILTYRYIDGMKSVDVAEKVGYTKGRVSQIIAKYVKD